MPNYYKIILYFYIFIICVLTLCDYIVFDVLKSAGNVEVYFLNIGQGDASLIKTKQNRYILIDGGPDNTLIQKIGKYVPFYRPVIDIVIVTHPDLDHFLGIVELVRRYKINYIILTKQNSDIAAYKQLEKEIFSMQIPIIYAETISILELDDMHFDFFHPKEFTKVKDSNDGSIVFKMKSSAITFLFTGDAGLKTEELLLSQNLDLKTDVLKVGHHGSKTSTSKKFLTATNPKIATVSVGENNFGHPHPEVINQLHSKNIYMISTYDHGDILIKMNDGGNSFSVVLEK